MYVNEILTFEKYWADPRFRQKRPNLHGSRMQAFGDNIYHRADNGEWVQANSFHSLPTGETNVTNLRQDTRSTRVLLGWDFKYWGGSGPMIPSEFRSCQGLDICARRGHKNKFPNSLASAFIAWLADQEGIGYLGSPLEWRR